MTHEINVDMYAGGLVFWKATMLPASVLRDVCGQLGLDVAWYSVNDGKALELALLDRYRRTGVMVRPTKPVEVPSSDGLSTIYRPAFVTVSEQAGNKQNDYANLRCFWLDEAYNVWTVDQNGAEYVDSSIDAKRYRDMVLGNEVSFGVEKIVKLVGGYKLRDNARIYYMPTGRMGRWDEVVEAFERLGLIFFRANCPADSDTAAAVSDNAAEELRERYQKAIEEITACDDTLADNGSTKRSKSMAEKKRATLLAELEAVKQEAATIDASFRGLLSLASEIGTEIDTAIAMAILATAN